MVTSTKSVRCSTYTLAVTVRGTFRDFVIMLMSVFSGKMLQGTRMGVLSTEKSVIMLMSHWNLISFIKKFI